jgi:hypothetical protein
MAAPIITPATLSSALINEAYVFVFAATGGTPPYTSWAVSSGSLPTGMNFDTETGSLYGVPTDDSGSPYSFSLTVTDSAAQTSAPVAFTLAVSALTGTTLASCVNWVATDVLKRQDLTAALNDSVVNFYKLLTRKIPFDELMCISTAFPVVSGQAMYNLDTILDVNGNPLDPPLKSIYSIRFFYGPQNPSQNQIGSVRLRRSASRLYDALSYIQPGQTSTYARFGKNIELNPPPNNSQWSLRFRYWGIAPLAATPVNTVIIMDEDWAELIRWELLYRAYYLLGNTQEAANLVAPSPSPLISGSPRRRLMTETGIIPRLWNDLCNTLSARENADEDFSINPVVRDYSVR